MMAISPLDLRPDNTIPSEWAVSEKPVLLQAAAGRIADLAVAVTGDKKNLNNVRIEIDSLVSDTGGIIDVPADRIRTVVCSYRPLGGLSGPADWKAKDSYAYIPFALMYDSSIIQPNHQKKRATVRQLNGPDFIDDVPPLKGRLVPANEMRQWYIMIPVPEHGVQAGVYRGNVRAISDNQIIAQLPVELTVLPFTPLPPAKLYGIYENLNLPLDDPRYKLMLADLVETGIHNPWLFIPATQVKGKNGWHISFEEMEKLMTMRYEAGMDSDLAVLVWNGTGINFWGENKAEYLTKAAKKLRAWWDIRGFTPDLAIYGVDESSGPTLRKNAKDYRAVVASGVKIATACSPGYFNEAGDTIHYPIISAGMHPDDGTIADVARAHKAGMTVLNYNEPQLIYHDPMLYRVRSGFNLWNNIYDGWYPFTYAWDLQNAHKNHGAIVRGGDATYKVHGVVLIGKDRIIPQVEWPAVRQGIDDVRYATTLAAQILTAREKNLAPELTAQAEKLLRDPGVKEDDWTTIEPARQRIIEMILAMEKVNPALNVVNISRGDVKALNKKINLWIRPELTFRAFPMGIPELQEELDAITTLVETDPVKAMFTGIEAKETIRKARAEDKINAIEALVARGMFGDLIMAAEQKSLDSQPPKDGGPSPLEKSFTVVKEINKGWTFEPDRNNVGLKEKWFLPEYNRAKWSPIDVTKMWQQQGRTDWQELEGSRVGQEGIGWYAYTLDATEADLNKKLYLWFICDEEALVWVNGQLVRTREEGSMLVRWTVPALAPLTGLKAGKNTIVIRILNLALGGGIWNKVQIVTPK